MLVLRHSDPPAGSPASSRLLRVSFKFSLLDLPVRTSVRSTASPCASRAILPCARRADAQGLRSVGRRCSPTRSLQVDASQSISDADALSVRDRLDSLNRPACLALKRAGFDVLQGLRADRRSQHIFEPCAFRLPQTSSSRCDILRCTRILRRPSSDSGARRELARKSRRRIRLSLNGARVFSDLPTTLAPSGPFGICVSPTMQPASVQSGRSFGPGKVPSRSQRVRAELRGAWANSSALTPPRLHFAYIITYQKVHAGRACSPQQIIGRRPLLMISPWRPRRGSRLPAEKLLCARSLHQLCCTKSIRSLVLLGTQKGRVHCRSALAEPRRSFAITSPGSGLDQSAPRRDFCSRRPFSFVLVSLKIQRHT